LFAVDGALDVGARRLHAAHELDDHADARVLEDRGGIGGDRRGGGQVGAPLGGVAHQHPGQLDRSAGALGDEVALALQPLGDLRSHDPQAEQPHADGVHHGREVYGLVSRRRSRLREHPGVAPEAGEVGAAEEDQVGGDVRPTDDGGRHRRRGRTR